MNIFQKNRAQYELFPRFLQKRDISEAGSRILRELFKHALSYEKSWTLFFEVCEEQWRLTWQYQPPWQRADPEAFDVRGIQNRASFENICRALKIPSLPSNELHIPMDSFIVMAGHKYRFGGSGSFCTRLVRRDGLDALDFECCRIARIALGEPMKLMPEGSVARDMHITESPVRLLERA